MVPVSCGSEDVAARSWLDGIPAQTSGQIQKQIHLSVPYSTP